MEGWAQGRDVEVVALGRDEVVVGLGAVVKEWVRSGWVGGI